MLVLATIAAMGTGYQATTCMAESTKKPEIVPIKLGETRNTKTLAKKIFFAGQPAESDFKQIAEWGVQTVVNFRSKPEMEHLPFNEKKVVEALGMKYIHIPIGRERLEDPVLDKIVQTIAKGQEKDKKLMLHCASAVRVGFAWSLYLGAEGKDIESALAEGRKAGLRSPGLEKRVREYFQSRKAPRQEEKQE